MTTARDMIKSAMRKLNVLGTGQDLQANEAIDALATLNQMVSAMSVEGTNIIFGDTTESFALTNNDDTYTIGTGADFNTARPSSIVSAFVRQSDTDYPLDIVDVRQYNLIEDKDDPAGYPEWLYYDGGYPTGTIKLWPSPIGGMTLHITSRKALQTFPSLDTVVALPDGYEAALIYNLAIELAPEYEREPSPTVQRLARKYLLAIRGANMRAKPMVLRVDPALRDSGNRFNIYSGTYNNG